MSTLMLYLINWTGFALIQYIMLLIITNRQDSSATLPTTHIPYANHQIDEFFWGGINLIINIELCTQITTKQRI